VDLETGLIETADVVVRDGFIEEIGRFGAAPREAGALVLDLKGAWLIPGLVDAHAHLLGTVDGPLTPEQTRSRLMAYLQAGVTTIRDAGARDLAVLQLAATTPAPQIYASGRPIRHSSSVEESVSAARSNAEAGAAWLKAYELDPLELAGVLELGRAAGVRVGAHLGNDPSECLALGLKAVEHVYTLIRHDLVPYELRQASWIPAADRPVATWFLTDAEASWATGWYESVGARRPFVTSTLSVMEALKGRHESVDCDRGQAEARWASTGLPARWQARLQSWGWWDLGPDSSRDLRDQAFENICRTSWHLAAVGCRICLGTDFGEPLIEPGVGVLSEMKLLHAAGFSTLDVLRSATCTPADLLGLSGALGTLTVGARADAVAVAGNPLESLEALSAPLLVMAAGDVVVDRRVGSPESRGVHVTLEPAASGPPLSQQKISLVEGPGRLTSSARTVESGMSRR